MDLLLDTHTLLWFIGGGDDLSAATRRAIEEPNNNKFVSIVSVWEISIKVALGKIDLTASFDQLFPEQLEINGFGLLPIKVVHTALIASLPYHHRDPFDRMLISQAIEDDMTIVGADKAFDDYGIPRLW